MACPRMPHPGDAGMPLATDVKTLHFKSYYRIKSLNNIKNLQINLYGQSGIAEKRKGKSHHMAK